MPISCRMMDSTLDAGAQGQRNQPAGGLDLRIGAAAGLAHLGEDFADPVVVTVDRHVELAAAGVDALGDPEGCRRGAGAVPPADIGFALDIEHLDVAAAVPVNGESFAPQVVSEK